MSHRKYVVMPNAPEHFWLKERNDVLKGNLYEHEYKSKNLSKDRRVRIYTPFGYEKANKPYEFLLLTDGNEYINMLSTVAILVMIIYAGRNFG